MSEIFKVNQTTIKMLKSDLTALQVESIAFYARQDLSLGSGYGNAISTRGGISIKQELEKIGSCKPLESVITEAGQLNCKYIIHSVGPAFQEVDYENKLKTTINNALEKAKEKGIKQIAFPIMGAGFYGIPIDLSIKIMVETFSQYSNANSTFEEIIICANDNREYRAISAQFPK